MTIILPDGSGGFWELIATSGGLLDVIPATGPTTGLLFLNDPGNNFSFQITVVLDINSKGLAVATAVSYNASYPKAVQLGSTAYQLQMALAFDNSGLFNVMPLLLDGFQPDEDFLLYRFRAA